MLAIFSASVLILSFMPSSCAMGEAELDLRLGIVLE